MAGNSPDHCHGTGTDELQHDCGEETRYGYESGFEAMSGGISSRNGNMIGYGFAKEGSKYSRSSRRCDPVHSIGLTVLIDQLGCIFIVLSLQPGKSKHPISK